MSVRLVEINPSNRSDLNKFIGYPFELYRNHPVWVPPLWGDELDMFSPVHNPVLKYCKLRLLIAYRDGRAVGRIAGIINQRENQLYHKAKARFGWFDFEDDEEVSRALLNEIADWSKARGMTELEGPMSFTNLDKAGLLVEGFEELPTAATWYNYPYYAKHLEKMGYVKAADWIEHELNCPSEVSERFIRFNEILKEKYKIHSVEIRTKADIKKYALEVFELINKTHSALHGFVAFEPEQVNLYVRKYSKILRPEFLSLVADQNNRLIAFGISLPSISRALQKSGGRLFPVGWFHLLQALKHNDRLDLYLIGTDPAWRNKGVHATIFYEITRSAVKFGIKKVESNPELESNVQVQLLWKGYEYRQHKRRRTYKKDLM